MAENNISLDYTCFGSGENSCMENYPLSYDMQDTYRMPRRRGRPIANNAARERSRVKTLRSAFLDLQRSLPAVPPDTKLSKLDVLVLATTYIAHLMRTLQENGETSKTYTANGGMHPVKKWPMRARLYAGILSSTGPNTSQDSNEPCGTDMVSIPPPSWIHHSDCYYRKRHNHEHHEEEAQNTAIHTTE